MNFIILTNSLICSLIFISIFHHSKCQTLSFMEAQSTVNEYARELADLKGISSNSPYTKFLSTYHRFNACMLLRAEKLEVCRVLQTIERYSYVYSDHYYPLVVCKKIQITINEPHLPENGRSMEVYAYKCPLPTRNEKLAYENSRLTRSHTNMAYYISSGNLSSWAIMYYSHASNKPKIKPDIAVVGFPVDFLTTLRKAERAKKYWKSPFFKATFFNDVLPMRFSDTTNRARMSWSPVEAEERVQTFVTMIKENKSPYSRFQITSFHINICSLTGKQRADSCKHSFDRSAYTLLSAAGTTIDERCERKEISFEYLEMPPSSMAVLNCPLQADVTKNRYYLSAAGSKDDFIAFMQVDPHPELLADAVIHEIADIVQNRTIPPPKDTSKENV